MTSSTRTIIVDGANGFVGANFIHGLLREGHRVRALVRGAEERVRRCVLDAEVGTLYDAPLDLGGLTVIQYSLEAADLGLTPDQAGELFAGADSYWHFAASMKFRLAERPELFRVNVEGTRNTLEVFSRHAGPACRYVLVGTGYSCGYVEHTVPEQWFERRDRSAFRNPYEESKREGELVFREYLDRGAIEGFVVRLAHVIGESKGGCINNKYGIYQFVEHVHALTRRWPNQAVRIIGNPESTFQLVPIDRCVDWLTRLAALGQIAAVPPIVNAVDEVGFPVRDVVEAISRCLPIQMELVGADQAKARPLSNVEKLVAAGLAFGGRYLGEALTFDRTNFQATLGPLGRVTSREVVERSIRWYVARLPQTDAAATR